MRELGFQPSSSTQDFSKMQDVNPQHSCSTGKCVAELGTLHLMNTSKSGKNRIPKKHQGLIIVFFPYLSI